MWWPRKWNPLLANQAFFQIAMTGGLWTESRNKDPAAEAGGAYFLGTTFLWSPPVIKKLILWNPVTRGYLAGAAALTFGTALIFGWGSKEHKQSIDFVADPLDMPAKTGWAVEELTGEEQTWDNELGEFFLNGVGLKSKRQRDLAAKQKEEQKIVDAWQATKDAKEILYSSFKTIDDFSPEQRVEMGFWTVSQYEQWFDSVLVKTPVTLTHEQTVNIKRLKLAIGTTRIHPFG